MHDLHADLVSLADDLIDPVGYTGPDQYGEYGSFLRRMNGGSFCRGTVRMFGRRDSPVLDLEAWNAPAVCSFAWPQSSSTQEYRVFGETAWGDLYALRGTREDSDGIYLLESTYLEPVRLAAESIEQFLEDELLRVARAPYDDRTVDALATFGSIPVTHHWSFSPPLFLGGAPSMANVVTVEAFSDMIFRGDLLGQFEAADEDSQVMAIDLWTDDHGRTRGRLVLG